jgi:Protein of unknown function (DUF2950)
MKIRMHGERLKMEPNGNKNAKTLKQAGVAMLLGIAAVVLVVGRLGTGNLARAYGAQYTFSSPQQASAALARAAQSGDEESVGKILGIDPKVLVTSEDEQAETAAMEAFATKYEKMNRWVDMTDGSRVLYVGADNFAFPVPLAKSASGKWYFNAVAGVEEIRARDIGRNELLTIDACYALANAQEVYRAYGGDSGEYAQHIVSSAGRQDGLYWPASKNETPSPLASLTELPKALIAILSPNQPLMIDGYSLRILTAQGQDAPGGAMSYLANGKMSGGFAILATPVEYAETGVMTFMIGKNGVVYERDLGPDTTKIAASVQEFNPTDDWSPVE